MSALRSLLYAIIFYPATLALAVTGIIAGLFGRKPMLSAIVAWADLNHWLAKHVLGITTRVEGTIPPGPSLIAVKHQSMFETTEMVRLTDLPVIVVKRELTQIPFVGQLMRRYGVIAVERSAGAKALRNLIEEGKNALADGRSVIIYPEGTRVMPGETPELKPGFAALYRTLGLPVVPVALDSGRVFGKGLGKRSGVVTFKVGKTIPAGLTRREIEERTHAAINALELAPESRA
ncbi:MAG: lysophospholipid acyltransferase family protein [Pseudomonadota bacterium]